MTPMASRKSSTESSRRELVVTFLKNRPAAGPSAGAAACRPCAAARPADPVTATTAIASTRILKLTFMSCSLHPYSLHRYSQTRPLYSHSGSFGSEVARQFGVRWIRGPVTLRYPLVTALLFTLSLTAVAQYPGGQYPPGQYPPNTYPGNGGVPLSFPGIHLP